MLQPAVYFDCCTIWMIYAEHGGKRIHLSGNMKEFQTKTGFNKQRGHYNRNIYSDHLKGVKQCPTIKIILLYSQHVSFFVNFWFATCQNTYCIQRSYRDRHGPFFNVVIGTVTRLSSTQLSGLSRAFLQCSYWDRHGPFFNAAIGTVTGLSST